MKSNFFAILKFLTTFMICFSLLSIHVEKTPLGNISVEYSSVKAEESSGGMMSMITMLVIGVVTWRLTDMCAKTSPDILIAAAAGAIFVAGEATAILGHSEESDEGAGKYNGQAGGENEAAQTDSFKAQKSQAEATKSTGETKLLLQAAATVAFGIAAVAAFTSAILLETKVATCMDKTALAIKAAGSASAADLSAQKAATEAMAAAQSFFSASSIASEACFSGAVTCSSSVYASGSAAAASGAGAILEAATNVGVDTSLELTKAATDELRASEAALTAAGGGSTAVASTTGVGIALSERLPSKTIGSQISKGISSYETGLLTFSTGISTSAVALDASSSSLAKALSTAAAASQNSSVAATTAAAASACAPQCVSLANASVTSAGSLVTAVSSAQTLEATAESATMAASIAGDIADQACDKLTEKLKIEVAMCEPGKTSSFGSTFSADSIETTKTCKMNYDTVNEIDSFMKSLIAPKMTYDLTRKVALKKAQAADEPLDLFNKIFSLVLESMAPKANAGLMEMLGLAGPFIGIFTAMKTDMAFEWDNLLASPGNRAIIWTGLGVATAAATMQTNNQIAEKEEEIADLNEIINRMEGLDKDEQSRDTAVKKDSKPTKLSASTTGLGADFDAKGITGKSVNDRLSEIKPEAANNPFSVNGFPCVNKDKKGECKKFAGSLSVTGNHALDNTANSIGTLSDSLAGSNSLDGNNQLVAGNIASKKAVVDKALKNKIIKYNALRKGQGKAPINFGAKGSDIFSKLRGSVKRAFKEKGLSDGNVSGAFDSSTLNAAREAMLKANKERLARLKALRYSSGGKGLNLPKRNKYGRSLKKTRSIANNDSSPVSDNLRGGKNQDYDESLDDVAEDTGVSIFGIISNRYNVLKIKRRFGD